MMLAECEVFLHATEIVLHATKLHANKTASITIVQLIKEIVSLFD